VGVPKPFASLPTSPIIYNATLLVLDQRDRSVLQGRMVRRGLMKYRS
jgi:hypothetical protein